MRVDVLVEAGVGGVLQAGVGLDGEGLGGARQPGGGEELIVSRLGVARPGVEVFEDL